MTQARRITSNGAAVDYTPASNVAAGNVVEIGGVPMVATQAINANCLGSLACEGVFDLAKDGTDGPVFAIGDAVFWDTVNLLAVRTGGNGCLYFGPCTVAAGANVALVRARLAPHSLPGWMADLLWEDVDVSGGSKTLDIEDCGKCINVTVGHASNVVTLPAVAAGLSFLIRCGATGQRVAISPNANDKIMGPDIAGVDNKDQILAAATSKMGDYMLLQYGSADGYLIRAKRGIWAAEA